MANLSPFFEALDYRHSIYSLTPHSTIPNTRLEDLIKRTLLTVPSAFNTQSTRIVALIGPHHHKLWEIVKSHILPHVAGKPDKEKATNDKLSSFQNDAYATILFLEDPATYNHLLGMRSYADKFPAWREQTSGMHQLVLWTALEAEGLGVNVQHYNPLIDDDVKKEWGIKEDWTLVTQMVIGKPAEGAREALQAKEKKPIEERFKIYS